MKLVIDGKRRRPFLRCIQFVLFSAAAIALGYCVFAVTSAWLYQKRESAELGRLLRQQHSRRAKSAAQVPFGPRLPAVAAGGLIGRIEIPRLGMSTVLAEGTDDGTLRKAVGHIAGTALPGQSGNVAIAGHRDTFFRSLRNIRTDDIVVLTTLHGRYRYRVDSTRVVGPHAVEVLAPTAEQTLTLVTCYPFYFVGSAPDRFIVRATRIGGRPVVRR